MDWRANLLAYLRERLPSASALEIARTFALPSGASNETVALDLLVTCGERQHTLPLVLRPERREGILAPYDIARQHGVLRALSRTAVPVPAALWLERDPAIVGAPFFLMERVAGETLPLFWYGGRSPRLESAAAALAAIHSVDWRAAGLSFLLPDAGEGALASPLACDLNQWRARAARFGLDTHPVLVALGGFLTANEPADARHSLIHGDPNPGNYLMQGERVAAVLDWELAAIGDPRADLGFYAGLLSIFGGMPGEGGRTLLSDAYEGITGRPLHNLDYYEAAGLYKMALVMAGWAGRMAGATGYYGFDAIAQRLSALLGPRWAK